MVARPQIIRNQRVIDAAGTWVAVERERMRIPPTTLNIRTYSAITLTTTSTLYWYSFNRSALELCVQLDDPQPHLPCLITCWRTYIRTMMKRTARILIVDPYI